MPSKYFSASRNERWTAPSTMRETLAGPIQNQIHRQRFFYRIQNVVFDHGVEGDIIRYYDYKTDMLQSESRRLNEREALRRKWHCGDDRPMEEHSLTDGRIEGIRREWYPHEKPLRMQEYSGGLLDGKSVAWDAEGTSNNPAPPKRSACRTVRNLALRRSGLRQRLKSTSTKIAATPI